MSEENEKPTASPAVTREAIMAQPLNRPVAYKLPSFMAAQSARSVVWTANKICEGEFRFTTATDYSTRTMVITKKRAEK